LELVYLWVENYKNIKKQGFDFSPRFECRYDGETLTIDEKNEDAYVKDFFGENINVTAIVGENGSGKSSVISYIRELLYFLQAKNSYIESKNFLLYQCDNQLYILKNHENNIQLNTIYEVRYENRPNLEVFSYFSEMPYDSFSFFYEELAGDLLLTPTEFEEMKIREYADLSIERIGEIIADSQHKEYSKILFDFHPIKVSLTNNEKFGKTIRFDLSIYISKNLDLDEFNNDLFQIIEEVIEYTLNSLESLLLDILIRNCDEETISPFIYELQDIGNHSVAIKDFFYGLYSFLLGKNLLENSHYLNDVNFEEYYSLIDENILFQDLTSKDIFKNYKRLLIFDFIDNTDRKYMDLSHGEKILFGQIINFQYRINSQIEWLKEFFPLREKVNFLLLIDEPDISLHPQWQKQYLNILNEMIKLLDVNIHTVLTTHSPFLLSDIPKQNIIFLEKKENGNCKVLSHDEVLIKKQTFGANIHTLLSDSFFMEDGLMGEFAKRKINEIINFHKKVEEEGKTDENIQFYEEQQKKFWQTQSIVGEAYLKQILENHLIEIEKILLGRDGAKESKRERLLAQIKELDND